MADKMHLWPEETRDANGSTIAAVTIESPVGERTRLWYSVPVQHGSALTKACDPFVVATLFRAMREGTDLMVHGETSPSLLQNLEEFQAAWASWRPDRYTKIDVIADLECEQPRAGDSHTAITAFSGGVDSSFTVFRHRTGHCGRLKRTLRAGVMALWRRDPQDHNDALDRAAEKSAKMLASLDMDLIRLGTNFRELDDSWEDAHGAAIAACLMLFQGRYAAGLIASTEPYCSLVLPFGSNPVTDRLMSSDAFQIIHDGAAFTRSEKVREIANWPEALQYLRVCWEGKHADRNCGRCEKCVRTILNFRVMGLGLPECFEQDVSDDEILSLRGLSPVQSAYLQEVLSAARAESIAESWVTALEQCLERNRPRQSMKILLRSRLRQGVKRIPGAHKLWHLIKRPGCAQGQGAANLPVEEE
jgi:hypothetical protein